MNKKAIIFGIKGKTLSTDEKKLFKKNKPWGIILFSRNIETVHQVMKLTNEIKKLFNDKKYPILIDQEGGVVSRLNKIMDLSMFSQNFFTKLYIKNYKNFSNYYQIYINSVSGILKLLGININTVPVLDIYRPRAHKIIGTRSFSNEARYVCKLGNLCIKLYKKNKIAAVVKHIPGHGASKYDSHFKTPIIKIKKNKLIKKDFLPFKKCKSLFAMTAHAIYEAFDKDNTATHSKTIIEKIIRKRIQFRGILISDDISMKSLKYSLEKNALKAISAGCNLVLHCNGNIREMKKLSEIIPNIDKFTQKKTSQFKRFLG